MTSPRPSTSGAPTPPDEAVAAEAEVAAELAPMEKLSKAVRDDALRLRALVVSVRSPLTLIGFSITLAASAVGLVTVLVVGFHDWYMHLGMHLVMHALVLLYFRALVRRRRIRLAGYALVTTAMLLFFAWVLMDLAPPRLEIVGDLALPEGGTAPRVELRGEASPLIVSAALYAVAALWLVAHWVTAIVTRRRA